mmetsp:Transcript_73918/g.158433  ORF Transcript_73918/g.158433 Transcript_73918/m.158433 type:complete len:84 (-) Transcript_73918:106-357(-)
MTATAAKWGMLEAAWHVGTSPTFNALALDFPTQGSSPNRLSEWSWSKPSRTMKQLKADMDSRASPTQRGITNDEGLADQASGA